MRIQVTYGSETVTASGATLAHAVRKAAHALGLTPGRTVDSNRLGELDYEWDWSGHKLRVRVTSSGPTQPHAERLASGKARVFAYVSQDAGKRLDAMAAVVGSRTAALEHAIQTCPTPGAEKK